MEPVEREPDRDIVTAPAHDQIVPTAGSQPQRFWGQWLVWGASLLLVLAHLHLVFGRVFDPDEFEHLHVIYCMYEGQLPYRDFFEHHPPIPYFLTYPLICITGPQLHLLFLLRLVSVAFLFVTCWFVWNRLQVWYGRWSAWGAVVWLATMPWFVEKGVEWRPDVPGQFFLTAAFWILTHPQWGARSSGFGFGSCLTLASLCTPKGVFLAVPMLFCLPIALRTRNQPIALLSVLGWMLLAIILWGGWIGGYFAWQNALWPFLQCVYYFPATWPPVWPPSAAERLPWWIGWSPLHLGFALASAISLSESILRQRFRQQQHRDNRAQLVLLLAVSSHWFMLLFLKTAYLQYHFLGLPLTAMVVGGGCQQLFACTGGLGRPDRTQSHSFGKIADYRRLYLLFIIPLLLSLAATVARWPACQQTLQTLLQLKTESPTAQPIIFVWLQPVSGLIDLLGLICLSGSLCFWFFLATKHNRLALKWLAQFLLWIGLIVAPANRLMTQHFFWPSNAAQWNDLQEVLHLVPPTAPVLDGYTGLGCLRPHAHYWWWVNPHSAALMQQQGDWNDWLNTFYSDRPALIIYDDYFQKLIRQQRLTIPPPHWTHYRLLRPIRQPLRLYREDLPLPSSAIPLEAIEPIGDAQPIKVSK